MNIILKHLAYDRAFVETIFLEQPDAHWEYFFMRVNLGMARNYETEIMAHDREVEEWLGENLPYGKYAIVPGYQMFHLVMLIEKSHQIMFKLRFG